MDPLHRTSARRPARAHSGAAAARGLLGAAAALVLLAWAGPAAALTTSAGFVITGHGWGHGIGMSQWGAYGYAKHGWTYKKILKHYYTGIAFETRPSVDVRVRLRSGLKKVQVSCPREFTASAGVTTLTIPAGVTATTTWAANAYHVVAGDAQQDFATPPTFTPSKGPLSLLTATDLGDTGAYRGVVRVLRSGGALMMVNQVPLESYLRGVIPHEVSPSWPVEALKAQACAARAYALNSLKPSSSWDVYCDVRDQAYVGKGIEDPHTDAAVLATAGVTPTYAGQVISAYYFSCSGGHTENIEYGWPGASPEPYLKGVDDPYDSYASLHDWGPLRRTGAQLTSAIGGDSPLSAVVPVKVGTSPRIVRAALIGAKGVTFMDGNMLRMKLGLNSTWALFTSMSITPAPDDHVSITAGSSVLLSGRMYPALPVGASVRLRWYSGGAWHSHSVPTTRVVQKLGQGYSTTYSAYSANESPTQTTQYFFLHGKSVSPTTTVTVQQTVQPSPG
jgi:stage II sporulation protein D